MNRTSLSNSGRGLVLVGGVTMMGISLAMAQLGAQQRAPGQDADRLDRRAAEQEVQNEPRLEEQRRATGQRGSDARAGQRIPANGERAADPGDRAGRQADRRTGDGREQGQSRRDGQGRSRGPWLGVYLEQAGDNDRGASVTHVFPASPASRAGFRGGDVILAVNGQQVAGPSELVETIDQLEAGKRAEFTVLRRDQEVKLTATLADRGPFTFSAFENLEPGQADEWAEDHEHDEFYDIPEHAMELEAHRRLAEQHERIENLIQQLRSEVQALREELKTRR